MGALALAPARASAQYTLTFDPSTTAGNTMAGTYQGTIPTSEVTVKDGVASNFGGGAITSYANSTSDCDARTTTAGGGLCFQSGTTYGETGSTNHVAVAGTYCTASSQNNCTTMNGATDVGEFDFTTVGSNVASFISVTVGCDYSLNAVSSNCGQSTINQLELQIWNAAGTTELAYDFDPAFTNTATSALNLTAANFTLESGVTSLTNLSGGFRFEWANVGGSTANCGASCTLAAGGSDVFSVDNLKFDSQITPEPGTLALFGTGLVGLAPLMMRRRRRSA
ncbi:MAG TPA: PEP-CTERM sorting domain-containing protein [Gemmatimonadales bacterium]|jgi:hypothetical protein|nr:PEP-CTERM sorting domain-containing protein [Gemmatimonadales bacterium]